MGLKTRSPKRTSLDTEPPRWLIPCNSLFFTSRPALNATSARMSEAFSTPCPPSPAITKLVGLLLIAPLVFEDRVGCQQAVPAGNHHGEFRRFETPLNQLLKRPRRQRGIYYMHIAPAQRARNVFKDHFAGSGMSQRPSSPRVLLHAGHSRC